MSNLRRSGHDLVSVLPLDFAGKDAAICRPFGEVGLQLVQPVGRLELASVKGGSVTNHNLRRVLVGHHNGWLGQLRSHGVGVVWHQGLLCHSNVLVALLTVRFLGPGCNL